MDDDKTEKTIEIILQNQARFYSDPQALQKIRKESEKRIGVLEGATGNIFNALTKTNETVDRLSENVDGLAGKVDKLADAQKETDERLSVVIVTAEKFFSSQNRAFEKN